MTDIIEFHINTSELLEQYQDILIDYPSILAKLTAAKMNPLNFFATHFVRGDDLDGLIEKLLPDAKEFLLQFWSSSYRDRIFFTLAKNRQRKSLTSSKIPKPFERVIVLKCGYQTICEEDVYNYYRSLFCEESGVDWFPVFICGLLIAARDELIKQINENGDPLAPYVHEVIEQVLNPLLKILAYEKQVISASERHKEKSLTDKVRGVQAKELHEVIRCKFLQRMRRNESVEFKCIMAALESDKIAEQQESTKYLYIGHDLDYGTQDVEVSVKTIRGWLTTFRQSQK